MEDQTEDDVDVLDLVNNDNKNREGKGKFPISHNLYKLMKVCNLLTLPGMTRGMLSVMEATSRAEIESEQNILNCRLLDDNVGNETYHDKTISKERQYAPIEIYDGYVRNTHIYRRTQFWAIL